MGDYSPSLASRTSARLREPIRPPRGQTQREKILVVEDDQAVAAGIAATLDGTLDVHTCGSAEEGGSDDAKGKGKTPNALRSYYLDRLSPASYGNAAYNDLLGYLSASGAWTGSDSQITIKAPGLVHLIAGSSEYQFV